MRIQGSYKAILEKEMATHSSVLAWRILGTGEPGGLPSLGLHRVGHDWSRRSRKQFNGSWRGNAPWAVIRGIFQFSSVAQSCPTLCNSMNRSTPGLPVHHHLLEFTQTHVHQVSDAIQPSHPLSSPSPPAPNPSQNQSTFQWVNSSHEVPKVLELQL